MVDFGEFRVLPVGGVWLGEIFGGIFEVRGLGVCEVWLVSVLFFNRQEEAVVTQ